MHDPNPATHASAICKTTFDASAPVASDPNWVTCSDAAASKGHGAEFAFYIEQFKSASNFRLHIQHSYLDKRLVLSTSTLVSSLHMTLTNDFGNSIGPCVVEEDGTPIYCNVTYFGDRVVSAAKGDLKCDGNTCTNTFSKSPKTIKIPINQAIA